MQKTRPSSAAATASRSSLGFLWMRVLDTEDAVDTERYKYSQCGRDMVVEDFLDLKHRAFDSGIPENEVERDENEECGDAGYDFHGLLL